MYNAAQNGAHNFLKSRRHDPLGLSLPFYAALTLWRAAVAYLFVAIAFALLEGRLALGLPFDFGTVPFITAVSCSVLIALAMLGRDVAVRRAAAGADARPLSWRHFNSVAKDDLAWAYPLQEGFGLFRSASGWMRLALIGFYAAFAASTLGMLLHILPAVSLPAALEWTVFGLFAAVWGPMLLSTLLPRTPAGPAGRQYPFIPAGLFVFMLVIIMVLVSIILGLVMGGNS